MCFDCDLKKLSKSVQSCIFIKSLSTSDDLSNSPSRDKPSPRRVAVNHFVSFVLVVNTRKNGAQTEQQKQFSNCKTNRRNFSALEESSSGGRTRPIQFLCETVNQSLNYPNYGDNAIKSDKELRKETESERQRLFQ